MSANIDSIEVFLRSIGYIFEYPMGTPLGKHESLNNVSKHYGKWYYRKRYQWIVIESKEHILNIIRAHKLEKIHHIITK